MAVIKFSNNASTTLASAATTSSTSLSLASGSGSEFPSISGSEYFMITVIDTSNNLEIMRVTARSGDTLTVTRAQEGTTARAFAVGSFVENRLTAASLTEVGNVIALKDQAATSATAAATSATNAANSATNIQRYGTPVGVVLMHSGTTLPTGFVWARGEELSRTVYPDLWSWVSAQGAKTLSESAWQAKATAAGSGAVPYYSTGNGSSTFRVPKLVDFVRASTDAAAYDSVTDSFKAHTHLSGIANNNASPYVYSTTSTGVPGSATGVLASTQPTTPTLQGLTSSIGGTETAPKHFRMPFIIKAFGTVINEGSLNAGAIASRLTTVESDVDTLETAMAKIGYTCLIRGAATGAPHETQSSSLGEDSSGNVINDRRYVLTNPFGNNTPVIVQAELLGNSVWADPGFISNQGTNASYVQGVGIVVQTGTNLIQAQRSRESGGGHNYAPTGDNRNRCRVHVWRCRT